MEDQAAYLLWNIKKLFKGTSYLNFIFADFESLKDYSTLSKAERKNYGRYGYKIFDQVLAKMSGSDNQETHRKFLEARYNALHSSKQNFVPLIEEPS